MQAVVDKKHDQIKELKIKLSDAEDHVKHAEKENYKMTKDAIVMMKAHREMGEAHGKVMKNAE